eukprot:6210972-Pleurochrysis_carterae.AAC.5
MVVDAEVYGGQHAFLTQRQLPRMCLISTEIRSNTGGQTLVLSAPKTEPLELAPSPAANAKLKYVRVWSDNRLVAADMGDEAAAWLSGVLRHKCRLVEMESAAGAISCKLADSLLRRRGWTVAAALRMTTPPVCFLSALLDIHLPAPTLIVRQLECLLCPMQRVALGTHVRGYSCRQVVELPMHAEMIGQEASAN